MKKNVLIFAILLIMSALVSITAFAASGAAAVHDDQHIPWSWIGIQAINLGILLTIIFFAAKSKIVEAFTSKRAAYVEQSLKTEKALKAAEDNLREAREKLKNLENTEAASMTTATTEADSQKNKIVRDAEAQAEKLKADVQLVVSAEVYKVRSEIRTQIIEKSLSSAEQSIRGSSAAITQKSESGFLQDLGQVKA